MVLRVVRWCCGWFDGVAGGSMVLWVVRVVCLLVEPITDTVVLLF